jgi:hypothetical protein
MSSPGSSKERSRIASATRYVTAATVPVGFAAGFSGKSAAHDREHDEP